MNNVFAVLVLVGVAFGQGPGARRPPEEWRAFRGPGAAALYRGSAPLAWSDGKGIRWKRTLPGPGASSPIVVGDAVFVTCWSGYATDPKAPGELGDLRRHLIRVHKDTGEVVWSKAFAPVGEEDPHEGLLATHGYASSTPVSDGARVYAFLGKSGVVALDLDGNEVWRASVGTGSSKWKTGSGSSPALWKDLLLVNAADESQAIHALDRATGRSVWKVESASLDQAYGTPVVVGEGPAATLLIAILGEVWGLDPRTGKKRWWVRTKTEGALVPMVVPGGDVVYSLGGRTRYQGYAIRIGGAGDVTDTHVVWSSRHGCYVCTPLLHDGHLYWMDRRGVAYCARARDGGLVYRERLDGGFYSSPVRVGDRIYAVSRADGTYVLAARPEFEVLAHNRIEEDSSNFDGTPAFSDGRLYLRSGRYLYCIGE